MFDLLKSIRMKNCLKILPLLLLLSACGEPPQLKLTSAQRQQVDTLYTQEVQLLAAEMDSLCEIMIAEEMQKTVDSIYKARKSAEQALREKYQLK